jgi:hypothetical protein
MAKFKWRNESGPRYGDAIFNRLQTGRFLSERKTLFSHANTPEEEALLKAVQNLADSPEPAFTTIAFIGD